MDRDTAAMRWFAVQTRSRHEKMAARQLQAQGFATFLPLSVEVRQWSDRRKVVEMPLFPGYVFLQMVYLPEQRLRVLTTEGVVNFVGVHSQGVPFPDKQIEDFVRRSFWQKFEGIESLIKKDMTPTFIRPMHTIGG